MPRLLFNMRAATGKKVDIKMSLQDLEDQLIYYIEEFRDNIDIIEKSQKPIRITDCQSNRTILLTDNQYETLNYFYLKNHHTCSFFKFVEKYNKRVNEQMCFKNRLRRFFRMKINYKLEINNE